MIKLGSMPPTNVQEYDFGYLVDKQHAGKTFKEAHKETFKDLGSLLENSASGHCEYNKKGILEGSNSFILALIREGNLLPENTFLYSPQDFARAFNKDPKAFENFYQDLGILLTVSPDQARELTPQIQKLSQDVYDLGFKKASPESPIYVPHTALTPTIHNLSPVFGLNGKVSPVESPVYAANKQTKRFTKFDESTSLAIQKENGNFKIYQAPNIAGAFLVYSSSVQSAYAYDDDLSISDGNGRVVVGSNVPRK